MTNEEAIKKIMHVKYCYAYEGDYEAFNMAIEALSADRPTGKWVYNSLSDKWRCNQCFQSNDKKSDFCPNCGAKMVKEDGE